ncbi:MAG: tRNA uracil 4-sulfurtransferase ThiI [bacterium]|nr:tRNA uracil 4-sulfurtransferase ThiI [bacterium]
MFDRILISAPEIGLKGKNRAFFEDVLMQNIRQKLEGLPLKAVKRSDARIMCVLPAAIAKADFQSYADRLRQVFGISWILPAKRTAPDITDIEKEVLRIAGIVRPKTFAIRSKRSDKKFPIASPEVNRRIGAAVVVAGLSTVNLTSPEIIFDIIVSGDDAFIAYQKVAGPGGMPVGTAGKVVALLSGGIDSPVAAWKVMKRGCEVINVHFHSYPHTSRSSIAKVQRLARIIGQYQPQSILYLVPFAEAQRAIVMRATPKYRVLLYRRMMMRIAEALADRENAQAVVTGESIGQVASQTLSNIRAVDAVCARPVFRPLIGDDKEEIIARARQIGTFETSIEPHDDCCTLFVPDHPATSATAALLAAEEQRIDVSSLVADAISRTEKETWSVNTV